MTRRTRAIAVARRKGVLYAPLPIPTDSAAQQKVFSILELVENILALSNMRTIMTCQRVNKFMHAITQSRRIRRALWLAPDCTLRVSAPGKVLVNPLLLEACRYARWQDKRCRKPGAYPEHFLMNLTTRIARRRGSYAHRISNCQGKDFHNLVPPEVFVEEIDIVTNRVRFLQKLLDGTGSWKSMFMFQPNPWQDKSAVFGYWVYENSRVDRFSCNGFRWKTGATVEDVLKMVLCNNRDICRR